MLDDDVFHLFCRRTSSLQNLKYQHSDGPGHPIDMTLTDPDIKYALHSPSHCIFKNAGLLRIAWVGVPVIGIQIVTTVDSDRG